MDGEYRQIKLFDFQDEKDFSSMLNGAVENLVTPIEHTTEGEPNPAFDIFQRAMAELEPKEIAKNLGLHGNTVARWIETQRVPRQYLADFQRMLGDDCGVKLSSNGARDKDQFYTRAETARYCWDEFVKVALELMINLNNYTFIEPSAGCGRFYSLLPEDRRIGMDVEPRNIDIDFALGWLEIQKADFLRWHPEKKGKYVLIGNPPFGLRGHLALQFINHAAEFADMVAFILPQLFESDGKGVPAKRVDRRYKLAYSRRLPSDWFDKPCGESTNISTVFQVWTAVNQENITIPERATCKEFVKIYSLSNGGTPSSTRNKHMLYKCDVYLPSTCFSGMKAYSSFDELPNRRGYGVVIHKEKSEISDLLYRHDWNLTAFPSTNGALNLRTSLIEDVIIGGGYSDGQE